MKSEKRLEVVFKSPSSVCVGWLGPTPRQQDHIQGNLTIKCPHCHSCYTDTRHNTGDLQHWAELRFI